jgi:hypothetical protein
MAKQLPVLSEIQYGVLMDAIDDAIQYRLGECDLNDPGLDEQDSAFARRYYALLELIKPTGTPGPEHR